MNRYIVKQISMSEEPVDYVVDGVIRPSCEADLPNLFGWDGAIARSKKWEAKMNLMHCDDETMFKGAYLALYNDKYEVEALNLDHVFQITNLWDCPDQVHTFEVGHSTSVGDLIEDTQTGAIYLVAGFGFKQVVAPRESVQFTVEA
tara:strand:+ start:1431 stop:1868 length:438 start_codon:yes stop_codon:yes gene_type:complete